MCGSAFETSHTMTSPLVHPVASREARDVISKSVHVTSRMLSSGSDWSPSSDVIPGSSSDVIVVISSRNSRSTGKSRDLLMSYRDNDMFTREFHQIILFYNFFLILYYILCYFFIILQLFYSTNRFLQRLDLSCFWEITSNEQLAKIF